MAHATDRVWSFSEVGERPLLRGRAGTRTAHLATNKKSPRVGPAVLKSLVAMATATDAVEGG